MTSSPPSRRRALLALILLAPVPSLGVVTATILAPGPLGQAFFLCCKLWILIFPALWYLAAERARPSWSPPSKGGLGVGAATGLAVGVAILVAGWITMKCGLDAGPLRAVASEIRLGSPGPYVVGALAWTLANSLMEEYVYRWFVLRQCAVLMRGPAAITTSAAVFTAHHVIAVSRYLDPLLTGLASAGVFMGGVLWAWLYRRYESIWPAWISHVLADAAVFTVGWWLIFG